MRLGKVYLVGAGPGDPGLLTVRGQTLLRQAGVVIYDRLVNPRLLEETTLDTLRIFVGKASGNHNLPQEEINELIIQHARQGRLVVRLKGGDPFVFGRGGEEAGALAKAGVPFEIVPGVSSAVAAPAYAGIPLTHRQLSSSFAVVTGHESCKESPSVDWAQLATAVDTLVVLMGLKSLASIVSKLVAGGRSTDTPAAVIRWGTTDEQEIVTGILSDIVEKSRGLKPPVVAVIGRVVLLRDQIRWFKEIKEILVAQQISSDGTQPQIQP